MKRRKLKWKYSNGLLQKNAVIHNRFIMKFLGLTDTCSVFPHENKAADTKQFVQTLFPIQNLYMIKRSRRGYRLG